MSLQFLGCKIKHFEQTTLFKVFLWQLQLEFLSIIKFTCLGVKVIFFEKLDEIHTYTFTFAYFRAIFNQDNFSLHFTQRRRQHPAVLVKDLFVLLQTGHNWEFDYWFFVSNFFSRQELKLFIFFIPVLPQPIHLYFVLFLSNIINLIKKLLSIAWLIDFFLKMAINWTVSIYLITILRFR